METIEIKTKKRDISTKGALKTLNKEGQVPAIVYGGKKDSMAVSLNAKEFTKLMRDHGTSIVLKLTSGSGSDSVLIKDIQRHPLTQAIHHIDFQRISLKEKIEVNIPLHLEGEAPGVKQDGGVIEHILRELRVRCLPTAIPEAINVDVSSLELNTGIKVKDLTLPKELEVITEDDHVVVHVLTPRVEEEAAPAPAEGEAAAEGAEPEVIAKGKKPEEGEGEGAEGAPKAEKK